jgi:hypothetical protein
VSAALTRPAPLRRRCGRRSCAARRPSRRERRWRAMSRTAPRATRLLAPARSRASSTVRGPRSRLAGLAFARGRSRHGGGRRRSLYVFAVAKLDVELRRVSRRSARSPRSCERCRGLRSAAGPRSCRPLPPIAVEPRAASPTSPPAFRSCRNRKIPSLRRPRCWARWSLPIVVVVSVIMFYVCLPRR